MTFGVLGFRMIEFRKPSSVLSDSCCSPCSSLYVNVNIFYCNVIQWFPRRCPQWLSFSALVLLLNNIYLHHLFGLFGCGCVALPFFPLVIIFPQWVFNGHSWVGERWENKYMHILPSQLWLVLLPGDVHLASKKDSNDRISISLFHSQNTNAILKD